MKAFIVALLVVTPLLISSCDSSVEEGFADVTVQVTPKVGSEDYSGNASDTYTIGGATATIESARVYLSGFSLSSSDGMVSTPTVEPITVPAKGDGDSDISHTVSEPIYLFKHDVGQNTFSLGEVASGTYNRLQLTFGIEGTNNRVDATQVPTDHSLAKQTDKNNHWNWNAGYIFLRLDGKVDSDGDNVPDEPWEMHMGTAQFTAALAFTSQIELRANQSARLDLEIDYQAIMASVDLTNPEQRIVRTMNNVEVTRSAYNQVSNAIKFVGVN